MVARSMQKDVSKDIRIVSLDESNELGKIMSSRLSKTIIGYLSTHAQATATQIAKASDAPLSSVQHHLKLLLQAKIISNEDFSYSSKGRKVDHYTLTEDIIVFAPQGSSKGQVMQSLKMLLPTTLLLGGLGLIGSILTNITGPHRSSSIQTETMPVAARAVPEADAALNTFAAQAAPVAVTEGARTPFFLVPEFYYGVLTAALILFLVYFIVKKTSKTIRK